MINRTLSKLLVPGLLLLLQVNGEAARAQDEGLILTIPALDSVTPDTEIQKDREFYGAPGRNIPDAVSLPQQQPPAAGDFAVTIRTRLLNQFVEDQKVESNNVATRVMEADVRGVQTTVTNIGLESTDNSEMARLNVVAQGTVNSNTIGYTRQAQVATSGNHTFRIYKPIYFDGQQFLTKPAYGGLQVRQVPQSVNSVASRVPLFGPIGDQIAWSEVLRRMPASNSIVARRVADDVFPKVNSSVDEKLRDLNLKWGQMQQRLKVVVGQDDVDWRANSSSDSFTSVVVNRSVARTSSSQKLQTGLDQVEAAAVLVSQDSVNHLLDKLPIGGVTVSDMTLQNLVAAVQQSEKTQAAILNVFQRLDEYRAEPLLFSLTFANTNPVQFLFQEGLLQCNVNFQVLPKLGTASQMQQMQIRLGGKTTNDGKWSLFVREIDVEPASTNELPDAWTKLIGDQATVMTDKIPPTELPRQIDLRRFDARLPVLRIHRIQSTGGQLRVSFKSEESEQVTTRRLPW